MISGLVWIDLTTISSIDICIEYRYLMHQGNRYTSLDGSMVNIIFVDGPRYDIISVDGPMYDINISQGTHI